MLWLALAAALLTWGLTALYVRLLNASGRLDVPNDRSMHVKPKPSGAGLVAIPVILLLWWTTSPAAGDLNRVVIPCALALSAIGWADDMVRLRARVRFLAYLSVIGIYLALLPPSAQILHFMPVVLERLIIAAALLWYVNLFNFMDGIDGIAGTQAACLGIGFVAVAGVAAPGASLALLIAAAMLGYLYWNWAPGSVMMGDAGSIPLGFLTGVLMLELAFEGYLAAALILPAYFCIDASVTLVRRLLAGHRFYDSHREHFYQRAASATSTHASVVVGMIVANAGLLGAALVSRGLPIAGVLAAGLVMAGFFAWLAQTAARKAPA